MATAMLWGAFAHAQNRASTGAVVVTAAANDSASSFKVIAGSISSRGLSATPTEDSILVTAENLPNRVTQASLPAGMFAAGALRPAASVIGSNEVWGTGQAGFSGDGGAAAAAELDLNTTSLYERSGIAVAAGGIAYIADTKNATIRSIEGPQSGEAGIIRSVAGKWGPRQNVTLIQPMGIAVDLAGDLYIADHAAGTVSVLSKATGQLTVLAHVASPASIAVTADGAKVFVASPETGGVFAIPTDTRSVSVVSGFSPVNASENSSTAGPCANLDQTAAPAVPKVTAPPAKACPAGLAVDGRSNLFVADAMGGRIVRVDAVTGKISYAVTGMLMPGDIAFDSQGDLFVSEQGRQRILAMAALGDPASNLMLSAPTTPFPAPCPQVTNPYTFCNEPQGGTTSTAAFTLTNMSGTTAATGLTITPPVPTNPPQQPPPPPSNFTPQTTSCGPSLAAGASCTINIAFTPQSTGLLQGSVTVTDTQGDVATVNLAGTGDDYSLSLISSQPTEVTVQQGGTATFKAQVTSDSVFGANGEMVEFACPANLPTFTTCAFTPCPVTMMPSTTTAFSIVIVTSTATVEAPPVTNPCPGPSSSANIVDRPQVAMVLVSRKAGDGPRFPLLALIGVLGLLALLASRLISGASQNRVRFAGLTQFLVAAGVLAALIFAGCHGGTTDNTATPTGVYSLAITGNALDANGNPLNASRALDFTLDVIKGR